MNAPGILCLRDRKFRVKRARIGRTRGLWWLEIESERQEYDGEWWAPSIYHQGLRLAVSTLGDLEGTEITWSSAEDPGYEHPEIGAMYVFGHHMIEDSRLHFGESRDGTIAVKWQGVADVLWDDPYAARVPFQCECLAEMQ